MYGNYVKLVPTGSVWKIEFGTSRAESNFGFSVLRFDALQLKV